MGLAMRQRSLQVRKNGEFPAILVVISFPVDHGDFSGHGVQILLDAVLRYDSVLREHARSQEIHAVLNRQMIKRWGS